MNLVQAITVNKPTAPQTASNVKGGDFKEYKDAAMKKAENTNNTAESTQNSAPKKTKDAQVQERFKNFHHANGRKDNVQNKSGQDAEQNTASDELQDETNTDLSCDSPYYSLLNGIVGILEGFGLLNEEGP